MKEVHVFDFDGTITARDTFVEAIDYRYRHWRTLIGFLLHSPLIVLMKLRLYPNGRTKQKVFSHFFKGIREDVFQDVMRRYAECWKKTVRPKAAEHIRALLAQGRRVVIVSASMDAWVEPIAREMERGTGGTIEVIATRVEYKDGLVTGRFSTPNCYGAEKVRRLKEILTDRKDCKLIAYGDSRGDKELLEYADKGHYKPFRQ